MSTSESVVGVSHHKIGSVALFFYRLTGSGGAERMICQLASALAERDFRVHLASWDPLGATAFYPLHPAVQWIKLGFHPGIFDKLRRVRALAQVLRDNRVPVLLGFVMSGDRTVYTAAKFAGARLVAAERNAPAMYRLRYNSVQRWLGFRFLHLADRITVQMPEFIAGYPDSLHDRIEVIPNPVPVASNKARPALANEAGRFTLLAVSRLDGVQKRVDRLIVAFSLVAVQYPSWDLRIIGDGPEREALHRLATDRDVVDRVCIEPAVVDIFDAYVQAHLFAIPSLWEGFPNALAEAMSHGLPAVGFEDAAGVAELIRSGGGGWLAKGLEDEKALAAALDHAMADGEVRAHRGKLAAQSMAAFAPEAQFDRWASLLETMILDKPR
jgi:GalNAc-alpha-(1->4)-GalNAc-alpha-(1->3)-diNAcBac-PP-undecaprenol alpha-1,4-N-acetyl-D-galactosaminyltransferase